jgi:hypothetical protein
MTLDAVDALITRRLIDFHSALIRRGQIESATDQWPRSLVVAGSREIIPDVRFFIETDRPVAGS